MKKLLLIGASFLLPVITYGADPNLNNLETLLKAVGRLINTAVPIIFALAILGFLYGLATYILGGAENKEKAKNIMIWGVIALTVMAAVWGLVNFVAGAFGLEVGQQAPTNLGGVAPKP